VPSIYADYSNEKLFVLMRVADAEEFNALCEEALRRGLVHG
jgi:hypothetical protein